MQYTKIGNIKTPRGAFTVVNATRTQIEEHGYSLHHEANRHIIMSNGSRAIAIRKQHCHETREEYALRTQREFSSALLESAYCLVHNGNAGDELEACPGENTLYAFSADTYTTFSRILTLLGIPSTIEEQDECWKFIFQGVEHIQL